MTYVCRCCDAVFDEYDALNDNGFVKCPECRSEDIEVTEDNNEDSGNI